MNSTDFTIGQVLYAKSNLAHRKSINVTVTKIARKWIYLDNGERFDPETMRTDPDNYVSLYEIYLSESAYSETVRLQNRWRELHNKISVRIPNHITEQDMNILEKIIEGDA